LKIYGLLALVLLALVLLALGSWQRWGQFAVLAYFLALALWKPGWDQLHTFDSAEKPAVGKKVRGRKDKAAISTSGKSTKFGNPRPNTFWLFGQIRA